MMPKNIANSLAGRSCVHMLRTALMDQVREEESFFSLYVCWHQTLIVYLFFIILPGLNPMGGHSDLNLHGEQWAPVYGTDNHWVQIGQKYGNSATTCYTHQQLEGNDPYWGYSSDNASAKQFIQCCSF